jgi:hypothetical protein
MAQKITFKDSSNGLHSIKAVEIFSAGKWNGDEYTVADLDEMVKAFEENKDHVRPFLKLGHSDEQKLLQSEGLPAAGWIEKVYRKGDKLMADFNDIPGKIYELIQKKAYRKVSCEIYMNCQIEDRKYKFFVGAVALLGAETPGVMNLDDILAHYRLLAETSKNLYALQQEAATIKTYSFKAEEVKPIQETKVMEKTARELELEAQLAAFEAEKKTAEEKITALETDAKKFAVEKAEAAEKLFAVELEKSVDGLLGEKLITPGMKPYVAALLGKEKAEFSIGEKTLSKAELVKELLKLFQAAGKVNLEEGSSDGTDATKGKGTGPDAIKAEVEKYATDNKVSFAVAYREVAKKYESQLEAKRLTEEE